MPKQQAPTWLGIVFSLVGAWIVLIALDVVPITPESLHAPRWVLGLCGLVFFCAGVLVWTNAHGAPWTSDLVAFVLIASLATVGTWVAFGPGERNFDGSVGLGPFTFRSDGLSLGRIAFGVGAVLTWTVALVPLWHVAATFLRPSRPSMPAPAEEST